MKKPNAAVLKDIEKAMFAIRFYPVAVDEKAKNEAIEKLIAIYSKGNDTVRQLVLYMIHDAVAKSAEFRVMHTQEGMKVKNPNQDANQLRMGVYRAVFNYNTSIEGTCDLIRLLGRLNNDDAAKVLTYHFSRMCTMENEGNHMLRAAIISALGKTESRYALSALLEYAKYCESERTMNRIVSALLQWEEKIDNLKIKKKEKDELHTKLQEMITKESGGTHYG